MDASECLRKTWQFKSIYILQQINRSYSSTKSEDLYIRNRLTVEHIMPQSWLKNWPLQDGSQCLTLEEILDADSTNHRAIAGRQRYDLVHTFGNLMLLRQSLNAEISNGSWHEKKTEIQNKSLLPINSRLYAVATWDEAAIEARSKDMFQHAVTIWISPE